MPEYSKETQAMTAYELVQQQAEDDGLWFVAESASEAYLQQELRKLHAAVEADERRRRPDPRDPHPTREGMFRLHNCSRCDDGNRPCVSGNPRQCEYPVARND